MRWLRSMTSRYRRTRQQRRALWEQAGVADDELSAVVLAAGIQPIGDDVASRVLRLCAAGGHAAALTLSQLRANGDLLGAAQTGPR